jgi:release factor glutamine methyltransferase
MATIKSILYDAKQLIKKTSDTTSLDAEILLAFSLSKTRVFLIAHNETELTTAEASQYKHLIALRKNGTPVAYITGTQEFWSLPLKVNEHTLIPRPETEQLVELTLSLVNTSEQIRVLDLGTGSGAIALALGYERPEWSISACDKSAGALKIANENKQTLQLTNVQFVQSNWFDSIPPQPLFDVIVSNPPYIPQNDVHLSQGDVRFEPMSALESGQDGLDDIKHIIREAQQYLKPKGLLLIEHGFDQYEAVCDALRLALYENIGTWKDGQGHYRISGGFNPSR